MSIRVDGKRNNNKVDDHLFERELNFLSFSSFKNINLKKIVVSLHTLVSSEQAVVRVLKFHRDRWF